MGQKGEGRHPTSKVGPAGVGTCRPRLTARTAWLLWEGRGQCTLVLLFLGCAGLQHILQTAVPQGWI